MPKRSYSDYSNGGNYPSAKRYKTGTKYYARPTKGYSGRYYRKRFYRRRGPIINLPEKKFFDITTAAVTLTVDGVVIEPSLNLVVQGNGESQMIGRKINIKRITTRYTIRKTNDNDATLAGVANSDSYRVALVQDNQCNGAAATIALLYEDADIRTFLDLENSRRFKIVKEWSGDLTTDTGFSTEYFAGVIVCQEVWNKKCEIRIDYAPETTPGTRVIAEVRSNNLFLVGFSQAGQISFTGRTRIRYSDD